MNLPADAGLKTTEVLFCLQNNVSSLSKDNVIVTVSKEHLFIYIIHWKSYECLEHKHKHGIFHCSYFNKIMRAFSRTTFTLKLLSGSSLRWF